MQSKFNLGDIVKADRFVDCFGNVVPERTNLKVTEIRLIEWDDRAGSNSYFHIKAVDQVGLGYVAASEKFFSLVESAVIRVDSLPDCVPDPGSRMANHQDLQNAFPCWLTPLRRIALIEGAKELNERFEDVSNDRFRELGGYSFEGVS